VTETVTVLSSSQPTADSLQVIPNPAVGPGPVEIRLPAGNAGALVRIHTVSGELVRRMDVAGDAALWDLRDQQGRAVTAGLYLVLVESQGPDGRRQRSLGRFVLLR
jgi:hypothetical protein